MVPFLSLRMPGRQACVTRTREKKLTSNMRLSVSRETSSSAPRILYPALFMSTVTGSSSPDRYLQNSSTSSGCDRSTCLGLMP